jgi:hypothetical protein
MTDNENNNPIKDALGPAAANFGKEIAEIGTDAGKTVFSIYESVIRNPCKYIAALRKESWRYFKAKLDERLTKEPQESLIPPKLAIAEPIIENAIRLEGEKELQDMFANLLASSMLKNSTNKVHPSFVEILKQINSDEAKILKHVYKTKAKSFPCLAIKVAVNDNFTTMKDCFSIIGMDADCTRANFANVYVKNLDRLGIFQHLPGVFYSEESKYLELVKTVSLLGIDKEYEGAVPNGKTVLEKGLVKLTDYGLLFCSVCVAE